MCTMGALYSLCLIFLTISTLTYAPSAHNITAILSDFPEYSVCNNYLSETKLADEINSRDTVTYLVLTNGVMTSLAGKHPIAVIKKVLSLHILLDYYDAKKLHQIPDGSTLTTTLYQTTGNAPGSLGFVNITDLKGGKVGLGSSAKGSKLDSSYVKVVKSIPYNLSVVEIDAPIIAPGILTDVSTSDVNITGLLDKAGCKKFVELISSSGVEKVYKSAIKEGLTLFAPNDEAFKKEDLPDLTTLTNAELVSLLQYHALTEYVPIGALKTTKGPISTLATNGAGKYELRAVTSGDEVTLKSGLDSSRIAGTVIDSTPLVIFTVDNVLLPVELFGNTSSPAPAPGPDADLSPSPASEAPSPDTAESPTPASSPPAPPMDSPGGSPEDSPSDSPASDSENAKGKNAAGKASSLFVVVLTTVVSSVVVMMLS